MSPKRQLLIYPGSKAFLIAKNRDIWPKCATIQHQFWKIADEERVEAQPPFEHISSDSSGENVSSLITHTLLCSWITKKVRVTSEP